MAPECAHPTQNTGKHLTPKAHTPRSPLSPTGPTPTNSHYGMPHTQQKHTIQNMSHFQHTGICIARTRTQEKPPHQSRTNAPTAAACKQQHHGAPAPPPHPPPVIPHTAQVWEEETRKVPTRPPHMTETNTPTPHKATIHTRESHDHRTPHSQQHLQAPQAPKQTPNHPLPKQQHVRRHTPPSKATWAPLPSPTHTKVTYRSYGEHDRVHAPVHSASTKRECLGTRGAYAQGNDNLCKCVANGRLATWPH